MPKHILLPLNPIRPKNDKYIRTKKRTTVSCGRPLWNLAMSDYSAGWMAPIGQTSAQVPQSMQASGSMV